MQIGGVALVHPECSARRSAGRAGFAAYARRHCKEDEGNQGLPFLGGKKRARDREHGDAEIVEEDESDKRRRA